MVISSLQKEVFKDSEMSLKRKDLLEAVQRVLDFSLERLNNRYTKNPEKIKWARVTIQAVTAANNVLRDQDLQELSDKVSLLERRVVAFE